MVDPSGATLAVTHNLCNALSRNGWDVDLYTGPHWSRTVGRFPDRGYRPRLEYCPRTHLRALQAEGAGARALWRGLRGVEHVLSVARLPLMARAYDVVHVQWLPVPRLDVAWLERIGRSSRVVYTVHNLLPHGARDSESARAVCARIYAIPDILVAHTEHTEVGLRDRFGVAADRIRRIPHGSMDHLVEEPVGDRAADRGGPSEAVILFFGQIRPGKGLDVLLQAAGVLASSGRRFRVRVVGAPKMDMEPHYRMIRELGIGDRVDLELGWVDERDVADVFRSATVVALPYREIDQSGVALTACTLGRAIVAARCGGLTELVEEAGNGLLVPPEDPGALAHALATILDAAALRARYEVASRRYATEVLSWDAIARRTIEAYGATGTPGRRPPEAVSIGRVGDP